MVDDICIRKRGVVVPKPVKLFEKILFEIVEVESKLPTVNCEEVAMIPLPVELEVKIELLAKDTPRASVPDVLIGLPLIVNPVGTDISTDVTVPEF